MQKFTIFTIILSTLVVGVVAELVVQDYLQKVYAPTAQMLQANSLTTSRFDDFIAPFKSEEATQDDSAKELADRIKALIPKSTTSAETETDSANSEEDSTVSIEDILTQTESEPLARIIELAPALRITGLAYEKSAYDNRLFQLIDTSTLDFAKTGFANIKVSNNLVGAAYELQSRTSVDAEKAFDEIRILANSFPNIDTNQTNQFGDRSFYINHLVKVGEVFLVIQEGPTIYAFSYRKDYHETFKTFFGILF